MRMGGAGGSPVQWAPCSVRPWGCATGPGESSVPEVIKIPEDEENGVLNILTRSERSILKIYTVHLLCGLLLL